jgi:hypothetical protein
MKLLKNLFAAAFFTVAAPIFAQPTTAQGTNLILGDDNHYIIGNQQIIQSNFGDLHSNIQPMTRRAAADWANRDSTLTLAQRTFMQRDNGDFFDSLKSKKPFLKYFYRTPANLYEFNSEVISFKINPMLNLQIGAQRVGDSTQLIYTNMRGVQLQGNIGKRLFFYSDIMETQSLFPLYVSNAIESSQAIPQAGFYKPFSSRFAPNRNAGYDYLLASGYLSFDALKCVNIQFGNGRNFIGDGYRSLLLSNNSNNYNYLKINTHYKFLHYQNIFAELVADHIPRANNRVPRKFMTAHYLSLNILKNLNISFFESVVYGARNGLELGYLNPIIFYRAVEQNLGSPDNAMVGMTAKYNFLRRFSVYGQIVFDELVFNELFINRQGWWGNKYGLQAGLKYADAFGLKGLQLQAEYNIVRPYTYTFIDSTANYTHYNQPLAHPLGANFKEAIFMATYTGVPRLFLQAQLFYIQQGLDTMGSNWGTNLRQSYTTRQQEYGNQIGQGMAQNSLIFNLQAQYAIRHNVNIALLYTYRRSRSDLTTQNYNSQIFSLAFRYNFTPYQLNF